jgi:AraC-like DNA-binding protein
VPGRGRRKYKARTTMLDPIARHGPRLAIWWEVRVKPARDPDEFLAAPLGRCVVGPSFAIWCGAPDLIGSIQWSALDGRSLGEVVEILERIRHPDLAPAGCLLVDFQKIDRVDGDVLLEFTSLARERLPSWSRRITRQAVIVPAGIPGILLSGALPSVAPEHPLRYVRDLDAACAFLGHPAARAAAMDAERFAAAARDRAPLVGRLRAQLTRDLVGATVEGSAAALGLSARSLQRELGRLGTCFRDELRRARVAAAEELLRNSDAKVDAIAERVGLGTGSRMSAVLRRERSLTASELRARARSKEC